MLEDKIRIAIITDVHGNLPALKAVLNDNEKMHCNFIYHLGDSIDIGPFPKECLELMLENDKLNMIMGNHEGYYVFGTPDYIGDGERKHQRWTHEFLGETFKASVSKFPYVLTKKFFDTTVTFLHYAFDEESKEFIDILKNHELNDLEELFKNIDSEIIFYGHNHPFSDIKGRTRYINPGSLGCSHDSFARFTILEVSKEGYTIEHKAIPYSKDLVFEELDKREVPEREFISKIFFEKRDSEV